MCRQAQSEIDAKKNDGRLGTRARSFNKLLDSFLESRSPAELFAGPPRVDVALVANSRIDWDALDDLDRDDGDDRIVAQALHARVDNRARLELFSHDMRPRDVRSRMVLAPSSCPNTGCARLSPLPTSESERGLSGSFGCSGRSSP